MIEINQDFADGVPQFAAIRRQIKTTTAAFCACAARQDIQARRIFSAQGAVPHGKRRCDAGSSAGCVAGAGGQAE